MMSIEYARTVAMTINAMNDSKVSADAEPIRISGNGCIIKLKHRHDDVLCIVPSVPDKTPFKMAQYIVREVKQYR
jgi:hypothetical protein